MVHTKLTSSNDLIWKKGTGEKGMRAKEQFEVSFCLSAWNQVQVWPHYNKLLSCLCTFMRPPPPPCQSLVLLHFLVSSCASIQPPASLPVLFHLHKIIFYHIQPCLPPSILLLLPLLPSIYQLQSTWQSNSCPLISPFTVFQWLFPVWCLFGDAD